MIVFVWNPSVYFLSELFEMNCPSDTKEKIDISIPVVEVTESLAGNLKNSLKSGKKGQDFNF